jgi:hypothetical protein
VSGDTLTIARDVKPRVVMAKVVHRGEHGMITDVEPSPNALLWDFEEVPVDGPLSLGDALVAAAADPYAVIVRAKPVMPIGRRAIYPDPKRGDWAAPGLKPVPRRWVGFDFDNVPCAKAVEKDRPPALFEPEEGAEIARRRLPPGFRDVACIIQVTASAGFKDGYRLRLWFWLDYSTTGDELKVWCKPALDRALLDDVTLRECQPHYIGVRVVGGEDPCPRRFALLPGKTDTVRVPDIAAIELRQKQAGREERQRREAERLRPATNVDRRDYPAQRIAECIAEVKAATEAKGRHPTYVKQCATAKAICDRYGVDWSTTKSQLISAYESLFSRTDANRREKGSTLGVLAWLEGRAG